MHQALIFKKKKRKRANMDAETWIQTPPISTTVFGMTLYTPNKPNTIDQNPVAIEQ